MNGIAESSISLAGLVSLVGHGLLTLPEHLKQAAFGG